MPKTYEVTEIAKVIKTGKPIERSPEDIIIFDSVSFRLKTFQC